ncbi:helix-turn-helix domain-containing protein [Neolewinella antarctica]|uniref:DNA-binding NarL/FixJ family response regulator n=1 Tax=Neolewinella antarctica TaxID=442734 RepID=A0ABX0XE97_9BACT|nr:LuxR C-terminal-related transcriptional regulator [Neolewinella antarctica]NJC27625.1 DNA-binding NarL/FixJ family response regulator [Neolewinella antarctica]
MFDQSLTATQPVSLTSGSQPSPTGFSPAALNRLRRQRAFAREHRNRFDNLTRREREVLTLIVRGKTNEEIATALYRSVHTVRTHRNNIWRQLGIRSVVEAVWWGACFDLV